MTTGDVARATGISRPTIYTHIYNGILPATWTGSRWDIAQADAYYWAKWCWDRGRCYMYPPDRVISYCDWFNVR